VPPLDRVETLDVHESIAVASAQFIGLISSVTCSYAYHAHFIFLFIP